MQIKYTMSDIEHSLGIRLRAQHDLIADKKNNIELIKEPVAGKVGPVLGYSYKSAMALISAAGIVRVTEHKNDWYVRKNRLMRLE